MEVGFAVCTLGILVFVLPSVLWSTSTCLITNHKQMYAHIENLTLMENTNADFTCELKTENKDMFRIEVKICEAGSFYPVCVCRWLSNGSKCANVRNILKCEADNTQMRVSICVRRNFTDVVWELLEQNSSLVLLKHTQLQVTYPPEIIQLTVNGEEVNGKFITKENKQFTISCFYTNGKPPVYIRMIDNTGHVFRSTNNREGTLMTFLSVYCRDMWPTVSCEAPGSKLNRSVTILVKCLPQLFYMSNQSVDLKGATTGLTLGLKSYTNDIKSCLMTSLMTSLHAELITRKVICELNGSAPEFNLTLRVAKESWLKEGIWMLHVITELGDANITVNITNTTVQPQNTGNSHDDHQTLILSGCALSVTCFSAIIVIYCVLKLVKRRNIGNSRTVAAAFSSETEISTPSYRRADGLIYGELDFADRTSPDVIIGSLPNTQYAQINFASLVYPSHD